MDVGVGAVSLFTGQEVNSRGWSDAGLLLLALAEVGPTPSSSLGRTVQQRLPVTDRGLWTLWAHAAAGETLSRRPSLFLGRNADELYPAVVQRGLFLPSQGRTGRK